MDYDAKYCNHKWEGYANIFLDSKLIGLVSETWGFPIPVDLHQL